MLILSLKANKKSFNEIIFNPTGLSIVSGTKGKSDSTKTFNGVGKSLMIRLIDFCLGSNPIKNFEELEGWIFYLEVKINEEKYIFSRETKNPQKIYINGEEKKLKDFLSWLEKKIFIDLKKTPFLTTRGLLKRFIRPTKDAYISYNKIDKKEEDYTSLILDSYLLGLNIELIQTKYNLVKQLKATKESIKFIQKLEYVKKYVDGKKKDNVYLRIKDLESTLLELEKKLKEFKIAENYSEVETKLKELNAHHQEIENKIFILNKRIEALNKNLEFSRSIENSEVYKLYEIAKIEIKDMIKKRMDEVEEFQRMMLENRNKRYKTELEKLILQKNELETVVIKTQTEINQSIKFLNSHGALKEYETLLNEIRSKEQELAKLNEYQELVEKEKEKKDSLDKELILEKEKTTKYLNDNKKELDDLNNLFREFSRKLYPDKLSGLDIQNNDGENLTRFSVKAEIDGDSSDGINSAKIFCYDIVKLFKAKEYIKFLIHDSRLFSEIDPRQIILSMKEILKLTEEYNLQYIFTINENILESLKKEDEEFYMELKKKIVKNLYDTSDSTKLLGIKINLKYE
ncbi:DUF2326 domain-containing protein [Cetobacterium sp.]|uniref:DUF2326 domain-containing protein n=1 Tax=Cetobacterium sp. TaxID=2071632 RepID=UPI003EE8008D